MVLLICVALLLIPAFGPSTAPAQEMMTYQLVLLKRGSVAPPADAAARKAMQDEHLARLAEQNRKGINVVYGPVLADVDIRGIGVLAVANADEARAQFAADPFVKAGVMTPEVYSWMGPRGWFRAPVSHDVTNPANLEPLVFGFLVRGPGTPPDKATGDTLQKGHLAYLDRLHAEGKLVMAGPLVKGGDKRGVVVYRVKDVAEAKALAADDPAVKAGLLTLDAYPWMTFKGILK